MNKLLNFMLLFALIGSVLMMSACGGSSSNSAASSYSSNSAASSYSSKAAVSEIANVERDYVTSEKPPTIEPLIEENYSITKALTDFSEGRAWVAYRDDDNNTRYGVIDHNGFLIWSISKDELGYDAKVTSFTDGMSCIYSEYLRKQSPGLMIINKAGDVLFDGRVTENSSYYYLGYGNGIVLAVENVADFSSNGWYICEINSDGQDTYRGEYTGSLNLANCLDDFVYLGDNVFCGTIGLSAFGTKIKGIYNSSSHDLFLTGDGSSGYIVFYSDFIDGVALVDRGDMLGSDGPNYRISSDYLKDHSNYENLDWDSCKFGLPSTEASWLSDGLINYIHDCDGHKIYDKEQDAYIPMEIDEGVYDFNENLIAAYPTDWNIIDGDSFSGNYATVILKGADGKKYVCIVDTSGNSPYEPIKIDSYNLPSWHGYVSVSVNNKSIIIDPKGDSIDESQLYSLGDDIDIGDIKIREGFQRIKKNSLSNDYNAYTNADGTIISQVYYVSNYENLPEDYDYFS